MKKISIVLILVVVLTLPAAAAYKIEKFYLANGLTVILSPVENIQAVCVLVYHKTGVRDDPDEIKGASYLYRNLMLLGTKNLEPYERLMFIEKNGGISNRKVNHDNAIFYQVVPESELNNALWLESERLTSLDLTQQAINQVKNNDYIRIYSMINDNVNFEANKWIKSTIFTGTVYQIPEYGNVEDIRSFNNQEIKKIYENFQDPAGIILVIAGKFNIDSVKKMVDRHFSGLASRPAVNKKYNPVGPRKNYVFKNWLKKNTTQHFYMYGIRAPSKFSYDHLYFNFIKYYLLDERIAKLERMINNKNNLDVAIHSEYTNYFESNALIIKLSSSNRVNLETAKLVMEKEFEALAGKPLSQTDLRATRSLMELDFKKDMAILEKRSIMLAENVHLFSNVDFEAQYIDRIQKITSYDIMRISKDYLNKSNQVILNVYPQKD